MRERRFVRAAFVVTALLLLPAGMGAAPASTDLRQSYDLLTTSFYSTVSPQQVLDGARKGLTEEARALHVALDLPALRAKGTSSANVAEIAAEISRAQGATHGSATAMTYAAIDGMAKSLGDRYTVFFTPEEYKQFNDALDPEKISGIGVLIQADPATKYVQAYYVVPGTPADRAGIQSGDDFVNVDGVSTKGLTQEQAVKLLRGTAGSTVRLDVRSGSQAPRDLSVVRTDVQPPTVIYRMLPQSIGYVQIFAFGRQTPEEFSAAVDRLEAQGVRAYVLDLRNNGGGYVDSALEITSRFIAREPLLIVEQKGAQKETYIAPDAAMPAKPLSILVNANTASASEITAGALQDDGLGVLVGEKTFGKGVMQTLTQLPDGAAIKITTAHYLTPKNRDINLKGIVPDYSVSENKNARFGDLRNDAQLQAAIAIVSKKITEASAPSAP